jgi:hypothetical protein
VRRRHSSRGNVRDLEQRRRVVTRTVAAVAAVLLLAALVVGAYVPRTILTGGVILSEDGEVLDPGWEVRAAPGLFRPRVDVETSQDDVAVRFDGLPPANVADTRVAHVDGLVQPFTVVAGPTPWRTGSVRYLSDDVRPGEPAVRRLLWRRVHVAVVPGRFDVAEVVTIDRGGALLDRAAPIADTEAADTGPTGTEPADTED